MLLIATIHDHLYCIAIAFVAFCKISQGFKTVFEIIVLPGLVIDLIS